MCPLHPQHPLSEAWNALDTAYIEALRLRGRSYSTEQTFRGWLRRFGEFHNFPPRDTITADMLRHFLTHLAVNNRVSVSTQQQAFNALLFLFRHVLHLDIDFSSNRLVVRGGKGDRDRVTILTSSLHHWIRGHLESVRTLWKEDRRLNRPGVPLPHALAVKYPDAATE